MPIETESQQLIDGRAAVEMNLIKKVVMTAQNCFWGGEKNSILVSKSQIDAKIAQFPLLKSSQVTSAKLFVAHHDDGNCQGLFFSMNLQIFFGRNKNNKNNHKNLRENDQFL